MPNVRAQTHTQAHAYSSNAEKYGWATYRAALPYHALVEKSLNFDGAGAIRHSNSQPNQPKSRKTKPNQNPNKVENNYLAERRAYAEMVIVLISSTEKSRSNTTGTNCYLAVFFTKFLLLFNFLLLFIHFAVVVHPSLHRFVSTIFH